MAVKFRTRLKHDFCGTNPAVPAPSDMRLHTALFTLMLFNAISSTQLHAAPDNPLKSDRWKYRPLVVIAAHTEDAILASVEQSLGNLSTKAAFIERKMMLYVIKPDAVSRNGELLDDTQGKAIRTILKIEADTPSQLLLIGLDGGVKFQSRKPVADFGEIFSLIDGMPMRQRELN